VGVDLALLAGHDPLARDPVRVEGDDVFVAIA
jgi:hypothetical protein